MTRLTLLPEVLAVSRLDAASALPAWLPPQGFLNTTRTAEELSIVCEESRVPRGVRSEGGWNALQLAGPIPFTTTGVLASLLTPLADARIGIFAISTFDTDYLLVKEADRDRALEALSARGYIIAKPAWRIEPATASAPIAALFEEYWQSFGFTPCFQNFSEELANLPGDYKPPTGRLAIAWWGDQPAGCVALKRFDNRRCEAKRLYVRPEFRGHGLGHALLEWVIREARRAGYETMVGDTMPVMRDALAIYERRGFEITQAYSANPTPGAVFLRLPL